ncbi:MAG: hypothetical protein AB8B61_07375 [Cyclobacteriaceae bacterium]
MRNRIQNILESDWKVSLVAAIFPSLVSALLVGFSINNFMEYWLGIFILAPFFIGLISSLIKGYKTPVKFNICLKITFLGLIFFCLSLIILAIEGVVCIVMASPIGIISAFLGCYVGYILQKKNIKNVLSILVIAHTTILPSFTFVESKLDKTNKVYPVTTKVIVSASKQQVWDRLLEFKKIDSPLSFIFRNGISYPIDSKIIGKGIGAIRYCNFSTGSFVEPIDIWDEPNLLHFSVKKQPIPMKELSPYDIHPKHLHGYFVSVKGQFKLTTTETGETELEGTTWYYNNIYPEFYWKIWTDLIIHTIHERILTHIKTCSEETNL